jgi:hypothetical protein
VFGIATREGAGPYRVSILARKGNVSLLKNFQAGCETQLATCMKVTMIFPDIKQQG